MYYTRVFAKGLPEIAEDRMFVVAAYDRDGGEPKVYHPEKVEWARDVKILGVVRPGISLLCGKCGELMKREMFLHTHGWMFTGFECPSHSREFILDVFPKVDGGTEWDYTNAFIADLDPVSNPSLPKGVVIENYSGPGENFKNYLSYAKGGYCLTPERVVEHPDFKEDKTLPLLKWLKKIFSRYGK